MPEWEHGEMLNRLGYEEPGPLPAWVKPAAQAVLRDLQRPTVVDIQLRYSPSPYHEGDGTIFVVEAGYERWLTSIGVTRKQSHAELLWQIADGMQEQVFPELHGSWGEARPECPGHAHPAAPDLIGGEAWWVCPRTERRIKPIGS